MSNELTTLKNTLLPKAEEALRVFGYTPDQIKKEVGFVLQIVDGNKMLGKCTPKSIATAVVNIAGTGLSLNPFLNESYLVPRYDRRKNAMVACLEPSYKGLQKLAMEAGAVKRMTTQVVYSNDVFEIDLADDQKPVTHKPSLSERGEILGAYCLSTLPDGTKQVEWMEWTEIIQIRQGSESWKAFQDKKIPTCVWVDHEGEMIRKTVIRRAVKYLPKVDHEALNKAIALDNADYNASINQVTYLESLLNRANISPEEHRSITAQINGGLGRFEAQNLIKYLQDNQLPDTPAYDGGMQVGRLAKAANEAAQRETT
jgi:phage RecT family recombinase